MLKCLYEVSLVIMGICSTGILFSLKILYGLLFQSRSTSAAMNTWTLYWPWDLYGVIGFCIALGYVLWYGHKEDRKQKIRDLKSDNQSKQIIELLRIIAIKLGVDPKELDKLERVDNDTQPKE